MYRRHRGHQRSDRTFLMHIGGKIEVVSKMPLKTRADLSMAYTPGVARVCEAFTQIRKKAFNLTIKKNTVAVVTDAPQCWAWATLDRPRRHARDGRQSNAVQGIWPASMLFRFA